MTVSKSMFVRTACLTLFYISFSSFLLLKPVEIVLKSAKTQYSSVSSLNFQLYDSLKLASLGLSRQAYSSAIRGFDSLQPSGILHNKSVLSIVDFSLPSFRKRLFIIDVVKGKLLFNTFVSHGRNSGKEFATRFSNQCHSFRSSLGLYVTGETYRGHHGYSLRLLGMDKGINDNALSRGIVMHGARYVNEETAQRMGCIGRSEGCPAIPFNNHHAIIELIKNGTCLFVYGPNKKGLT